MDWYTVNVYIKGAIHRPPYDGTVRVIAKTEAQAKERALSKLQNSGVWPDCRTSDFIIKSVEYERPWRGIFE